MVGGQKAAILAQVGHFYSDAVGQYYSGANTYMWDLLYTLVGRDMKVRYKRSVLVSFPWFGLFDPLVAAYDRRVGRMLTVDVLRAAHR